MCEGGLAKAYLSNKEKRKAQLKVVKQKKYFYSNIKMIQNRDMSRCGYFRDKDVIKDPGSFCLFTL